MDGKTSFLILPVHDLKSALAFYRDQPGLLEAWREGERTVAFQLPNTEVQLLISRSFPGRPLTLLQLCLSLGPRGRASSLLNPRRRNGRFPRPAFLIWMYLGKTLFRFLWECTRRPYSQRER